MFDDIKSPSAASDDNLFDEVTTSPPATGMAAVASDLAKNEASSRLSGLFGDSDRPDPTVYLQRPPVPPTDNKGMSTMGASDLFGGGGLFDAGGDDDDGDLFGETTSKKPFAAAPCTVISTTSST